MIKVAIIKTIPLAVLISAGALLTFGLSSAVAQDRDEDNGRVCLSCHSKAVHAANPDAQVYDSAVMAASVHAALTCTDCHTVDPNTIHRGNRTVFCARCHQKEAEGFSQSPHVKGREASIEQLPTCITCHGGHNVLAISDPNAPTNHANSVKICVRCHEDQKLTTQVEKLPKPGVIKAYENSIHGRALLVDKNPKAPACVDCHGSHTFLPADQPESPVYKTHIARTCGKCHDSIAAVYGESVHGQALSGGSLEAPTCTSCHGEHDIRQPSDSSSRVSPGHVAKTCSDCHAEEKIVARFGLKPDRISTFKESFHGAAGELGDTRVANCASCHGVHNIYPQSDPRSMINAANIQSTCGQCHKDLPADFAKASVHTSASKRDSGGEFFVRKFYIWFISILILVFVVYRILEYKRRVKRVGMSGK